MAPIVPGTALGGNVGNLTHRSSTRPQEPPPPALRRCIFGAAPPVTSEPCAFSLSGLSPCRPLVPPCFFFSNASRIFALRSSLAPDSSLDAGIGPPGLGGLGGAG